MSLDHLSLWFIILEIAKQLKNLCLDWISSHRILAGVLSVIFAFFLIGMGIRFFAGGASGNLDTVDVRGQVLPKSADTNIQNCHLLFWPVGSEGQLISSRPGVLRIKDKDGFFEGRVVTTAQQNQQYDYKVTIVDPQLMPFPEEVLSAAYSMPEATPLKVSSESASLELRVPFN
ncbi:hypothetical protein N9U65_01490 [Planctomycetaceae bacterium]|nr:hypothetical protein [Planctomycetaceae bacterium]